MKIRFTIFLLILLFENGYGQASILPTIEKEITHWEFRMVGDSTWKPAKVPGTIIDNFVELSDISNPLHPYYGDNEKLYQWVGERDWEFRGVIEIDRAYEYFNRLNGGLDIKFESLDLFAEVYINGQRYDHENAFYPMICTGVPTSWDDIKVGTLKVEIKVIFRSTLNRVKQLEALDSLKYPGGERVYARKAQYEFGWDWSPRLINMGIRKPVKYFLYGDHKVDMQVWVSEYDFNPDWVVFKLNYSFICEKPYTDYVNNLHEIHAVIRQDGKIVYDQEYNVKIHNYKSDLMLVEFDHPKLWWPNGMDKESSYCEFDICLTLAGDTHIIDRKKFNFPICRIELVQESDKKGESFYFTVNGEKVFAKGANYVPDDSFDPGKNSVDLIKMAAHANMNMIRIWGGGTYPDNDFYDECMKNGIMVWQDNMFACAMYPVNDEFTINATEEADHVHNRLQHYKNIALWCGNNECDEGWKNWGWQKEFDYTGKDSTILWEGYEHLFKNLLWYDTIPAYISTSPKYGWGRKESMTHGDSHYWGVWWGWEPVEKFEEKVPRFMSEFGMQSMPDLLTLKKVIPDSAMNFGSPKFKNHQKHPTGFETLDHYLKEYLVIPEDIEDYAYATQVLQAFTLTTAIESQRRAMPYCMGSLIWQLNDCWPVTSWSIIDYNLKRKIAYHEVSRLYEPVLITVKEEKEKYDIYIVNEKNETIHETLYAYIADFSGKKIWEKQEQVKILPFSSKKYMTINKEWLKGVDLSTIFMQIAFEDIRLASPKSFHFVKLNQLKLPPPEIKFSLNSYNHYYEIKSNVYCPYVLLPGNSILPEQVYLGHLIPGEVKKYYVRPSEESWMNQFINSQEKIQCLNSLLQKRN